MKISDPQLIPDHIKRLMSPEDQQSVGVSFRVTPDEVKAQMSKDESKAEKILQNQLVAWCQHQTPVIPCYHQRMDKKSNMPTGTPDLLVCRRGLFYGIEVKIGNKQPSPEQTTHLEAIAAAGGVSAVVRSLDEFISLLK